MRRTPRSCVDWFLITSRHMIGGGVPRAAGRSDECEVEFAVGRAADTARRAARAAGGAAHKPHPHDAHSPQAPRHTDSHAPPHVPPTATLR